MDTTGELTQKKFSARQLVSKVFETDQYNPDKLLAGTRREVQKVTVTIIITRPTDTEPAEYNQQQVNDNRHPVQ